MMIAFVLMLWGLTFLLTASAIFAPVRVAVSNVFPQLGQLVYCPGCAGFWIGGALALVSTWPLPTILWPPLDAAIASAGLMHAAGFYVPSEAWKIEQGELLEDDLRTDDDT
jgi:hypothetical protein